MLLILGFDDIIKYIDLDYNDGRLAKHCLTTISQVNLYDIYEPPRDCRRPNFLREYDNENTKLHS